MPKIMMSQFAKDMIRENQVKNSSKTSYYS